MVNGDNEFKQKWFGEYANVPATYLAALKNLTKQARAELGIVDGNTRYAYWIDGRSLGELKCVGVHNMDATITGRVVQLDNVVGAELKLDIDFDRMNNTSKSGRILTIRYADDVIKFDASPGVVFDPADSRRIETFIDQVLAALAGRDFIGATAQQDAS